jgi:hypothetical protein
MIKIEYIYSKHKSIIGGSSCSFLD